jgi:hypothetical protein
MNESEDKFNQAKKESLMTEDLLQKLIEMRLKHISEIEAAVDIAQAQLEFLDEMKSQGDLNERDKMLYERYKKTIEMGRDTLDEYERGLDDMKHKFKMIKGEASG